MTATQLVRIVAKFWGLYLLLETALSVPSALTIVFAEPMQDADSLILATKLNAVANFAAQLVLGTILFKAADWVAKLVAPDDHPFAVDTDADHLELVAMGVVGLIILVDGLKDLGATIYTFVSMPEQEGMRTMDYLWSRQREAIVRGAIAVAAGLVLVFGRHGLVTSWRSLRGIDEGQQELDREEP